MDKADIAALLALGAALFIAIGDVMHQRSAQRLPDASDSDGGLFLRLLGDRHWWLGSAVAAVGFGLQAAALGLGSVLLVQSLLVTSLLFALPIGAYLAHRRLSRAEWGWAALLAVSVAVIVTVGNPTAEHARASAATWALVLAFLGGALVGCLVLARTASGPLRAVLLAFVSGALWGVFAVLTKGVVHLLGDGVEALLRAPELYAWAAVGVAGTVWQQASFRAGSLSGSLPTMAISEPVVAAGLGVTVLGEALHPGRVGWVVLWAAVAAMVLAAAALARSEASSSDFGALSGAPRR